MKEAPVIITGASLLFLVFFVTHWFVDITDVLHQAVFKYVTRFIGKRRFPVKQAKHEHGQTKQELRYPHRTGVIITIYKRRPQQKESYHNINKTMHGYREYFNKS